MIESEVYIKGMLLMRFGFICENPIFWLGFMQDFINNLTVTINLHAIFVEAKELVLKVIIFYRKTGPCRISMKHNVCCLRIFTCFLLFLAPVGELYEFEPCLT